MSIFSGLEALGFKETKCDIYEEETAPVKEVVQPKKVEEVVIKEEDLLFPKTYKCPICDNSFKSLAVRAGKTRSVGHDDDLRPRYNGIDVVKYDAVLCPRCGYAALSRYFDYAMPTQAKKIREEILPKFRGMDISTDKYSHDEAILRYKMVLMCDVVGGVQNSRKAYTCLKMAWVLRGKLEDEEEVLTPEEKTQLRNEEEECIRNAYDGYVKAFSTEKFPMSGMDEMTMSFLMAQLAFRLKDYHQSVKMLANILGNKNVSSRLKDKALALKEKIRTELQTGEA